MKIKRFITYILTLSLVFIIGNSLLIGQAFSFDTIGLSTKIAESINQVSKTKHRTVAFSRISGKLNKSQVNELIDYTNVAIVKNRKFKVVDRSKLQLILKEQQFNLSEMVSTDTYKELGKLLGVDLFIYGRYYQDSFVFKAIDVESSAIIWSDTFFVSDPDPDSESILNLSEKIVLSIQNDAARLKKDGINQISFWNIKSTFDQNQLIDFISVAVTRDGSFQVVDRDNLKVILDEQKLGFQNFIDEAKAKQMGELYGIDAFIYGSISDHEGQKVASLKLLNIYNGVIEWADLIRFGSSNSQNKSTGRSSSKSQKDMVFVQSGNFLMGSKMDPAFGPEFSVNLKNAFYIDRFEVSNADYLKFVKRSRYRPPPSWPGGKIPSGHEHLPVVKVNWNDANMYCRRQNKRLPKEAEWEKAFRGEDARIYPWGNAKLNPRYVRTVESGILKPTDVNSPGRDISPYGINHMAGNVREWVDNYLRSYPSGKIISKNRVIRGGSWAQPKEKATGWFRDSSKPEYAWEDVGFRCAKTAK